MSNSLSKSRYTAFCQCPKNLWLKVNKPEVADDEDPSAQSRLEKGTEVGELAKRLFPNTVDVSTPKEDGRPDLGAMVDKTSRYMTEGAECIAEAAFLHNDCYCAVDLLCREGEGWAIYEVKSTSTKDESGSKAKFDKYLPDIAYQTWLLQQCGVKVTGVNLVCLNGDYVRQGELDLGQLFVIMDMRQAVENELPKILLQVPDALEVLGMDEEPEYDLSKNCNTPYRCEFWGYCTRDLPKPSVFDVYGGSPQSKGSDRFFFDKKLFHYQAGRVSYGQLTDQPLGHIQRLQVEEKTYIDRDGIRRFLDGLSYPLYFLDFETMQDAVPQYDNTRPYQQVPFQYSLHVKRSANEECEHEEFLAESDGSDPRRTLAEKLCKDIPTDVCVLAYNMGFEKGRIKELAEIYPDLSGHLMNIHNQIKDLIDPFRDGYYYVPAMGGSFSIKSVLPALFPNDPSLNYHNLSGDVHNGGEAMDIFPRMKEMPPDEYKKARESLLKYCELDTWAMVKIWEKLMELS